jgi:AmiR/NasT family two-component response regulator
VYATDWRDINLNLAKQKCKDCSNIEFSTFICGEDTLTFDKNIDVVFIDARHSYNEIKEDMLSVLDYFNNPTIIMDDFGNPNNGMKDAIEEIIRSQDLEIIEYIGEDVGFKTMSGWLMIDREGVILRKK